MKMIKFSRYVVLGAALAVVTGCNDAKLSTIAVSYTHLTLPTKLEV